MKPTPELAPLLDELILPDQAEQETNGGIRERPERRTRVILYISRRHLDNIFASAGLGEFMRNRDGGFQVSVIAVLAYRKAR